MAKLNAVSHGLRSSAPVVPGERAKGWNAHRAGMLAALAPVGTLETELADRAALLLWRLRRVTNFETNVSAAGVESVAARAAETEPTPDPLLLDPPRTLAVIRKELNIARGSAECHTTTKDLFRRLEVAPPGESLSGEDAVHLLIEATEFAFGDEVPDEDDDFYTRLGVPREFCDNPEEWAGWTVSLVLDGLTSIAEEADLTLKVLLARAVLRSGASAVVIHVVWPIWKRNWRPLRGSERRRSRWGERTRCSLTQLPLTRS